MSTRKAKPKRGEAARVVSEGDGCESGDGKHLLSSRSPNGKSGDRSRRARGKRNSGKSLKAILFESVSVRRGNTATKASKYEVVMRLLVAKALKGDWRLGLTILQLVPYSEFRKVSLRKENTKPISKEEAAEAYRQLMAGQRDV
jgi:hypothetical protein